MYDFFLKKQKGILFFLMEEEKCFFLRITPKKYGGNIVF